MAFLHVWVKTFSLSLLVLLYTSDRLTKEADQSSAQAGKHLWKVLHNGTTLVPESITCMCINHIHFFLHTQRLCSVHFHLIFPHLLLMLVSPPVAPPLTLSIFFPLLLNKVTAEELSGNDDYVELSFSARKLDDKVCATACVHQFKFEISFKIIRCNKMCRTGLSGCAIRWSSS